MECHVPILYNTIQEIEFFIEAAKTYLQNRKNEKIANKAKRKIINDFVCENSGDFYGSATIHRDCLHILLEKIDKLKNGKKLNTDVEMALFRKLFRAEFKKYNNSKDSKKLQRRW